MAQLTISGQLQAPSLKDRLNHQLDVLARQGLGVALKESQLGDFTFYTCTLDPRQQPSKSPVSQAIDEVFRSCVAQAVAETIVRDIGPRLLADEVRGLKPEYDESDVAGVLVIAERQLNKTTAFDALSTVASSVLDYLWEQESLNLEGFVRFRLGTYKKQLQEYVDEAVRNFESSREEQEFVKLLRYLIDHQEASVDELHIYPDQENSFEMRDQNGSSVDAEYLEAYVWDLANEGGVDREDLLISALVSLAPERVYWHFDRRSWKSPVLEEILGARLVYCNGCEHCSHSLN